MDKDVIKYYLQQLQAKSMVEGPPEDDAGKEEREAFERRLQRANTPKRYQMATFDNLNKWGIPPDIRAPYDQSVQYALHFPENKKAGVGMLFSGSVGRMKTTMAVAVLQEVIRQGFSGYFISMPELMDQMITMAKFNLEELRKFQERIQTTSLLVLDDFGAEYSSNWVLNKVDAIITRRYNAMLPVIITTNLTNGAIKERYVERVYDRLKQTSILITDGGESLRKAKT